ncbi:MAG: Crp/Fnr family transcriptional regulator [Marinobacter sp.]
MESQPDQTSSFCSLNLRSGDVLYHQGQTENHIYVIESGHLKLEHVNSSGAASISAVLGAGEILGPGLGTTARATQTVTAKGSTCVQRHTATAFRAQLTNDHGLMVRVIEMLAHRQETTERRLYALMTLGVRGRIALALRDLVGQAGGHCVHGHEVDVPLTQQELAELVGASRPVVSSELNELRRDGLLDYTRGHICVIDLSALNAFSQSLLPNC